MKQVTKSLQGKAISLSTLYFWPEATGIAPYSTATAKFLVTRGAEVTVIAGMAHYPSWKIAKEYRGKLRATENMEGTMVRRFRTYVPSRQTALSRALYEATFLQALAKSRLPKADCYIAIIPNLCGAIVAAQLARRARKPFGLIVQDLSGPAASQSGIRGGGGGVAGLAKWIERGVVRRAKEIAVVSHGFIPYLQELGATPGSMSVIPNWVRTPVPRITNRLQTREVLGWRDDQIVVLHAGNMGLKQGLESVVETARVAASAAPKILFVLMGDGSQKRRLQLMAAGLRNVEFASPLYGDEFFNALNAADTLLVNERPTVLDMSLPSKLTSYYVSGTPIVACVQANGATAADLRASCAAKIVETGDSKELINSIISISEDSDLRSMLVRKAKRYATTHLSEEVSLEKIETFVARLISKP